MGFRTIVVRCSVCRDVRFPLLSLVKFSFRNRIDLKISLRLFWRMTDDIPENEIFIDYIFLMACIFHWYLITQFFLFKGQRWNKNAVLIGVVKQKTGHQRVFIADGTFTFDVTRHFRQRPWRKNNSASGAPPCCSIGNSSHLILVLIEIHCLSSFILAH